MISRTDFRDVYIDVNALGLQVSLAKDAASATTEDIAATALFFLGYLV